MFSPLLVGGASEDVDLLINYAMHFVHIMSHTINFDDLLGRTFLLPMDENGEKESYYF